MLKQVSKRLLLNSALLLVLATLVYFIFYKPSVDQRSGASSSLLFSIAAYQAESIKISRISKSDILLQKRGDNWVLNQPALAPLNANRIKHLLTILDEPIIASYSKEGHDLSKFGLSQKKIELTISSAEKTEVAVFGSTNAVTLNRYILKDNLVHTINEVVYGVLGTSITPLLAHHLLPETVNIIKVDAPPLLAELPLSFWHKIEASNIADIEGDESIIGKLTLTVVAANSEGKKAISDGQSELLINFTILQVSSALVLARPDLGVKYTFDEKVLEELKESNL